MRRPTLIRSTLSEGLQSYRRALMPSKEDRPTMDANTEQPQMTAGLDIGHRYSYLCLIDTKMRTGAKRWRLGEERDESQRRLKRG